MKKLKIGIVGLGNISRVHREAYRKNEDVEIYAFCDINEERLKKEAEEWGITHCYTDVEQMVRELPELDAVSICVWNCNHAKCAIAALNAGKHVLCEKPIAKTVEEAEAMIEAARRNDRLLMVGFCCRFGTDTALIQQFAEKGFFGEMYYAKASYLRRNGNPGGWFANTKYSGGGPMIDLGVHIMDLTRYLMGNPKPVAVSAIAVRKLQDREDVYLADRYRGSDPDGQNVNDVEDLASAFIRYDNGAALMIDSSYELNIKENDYSMQLFGTKGGVRIAPDFEMYTDQNGFMVNLTTTGTNLPDPDQLLFDREIKHFTDCILHNVPCMAPAEDGLTILRMIAAVYESAKLGHEVLL